MSYLRTEHNGLTSDVLVVGAGPAGLAVAACVQREGLHSTVLERAGCVAPSWHSHYERLHLHTHKGSSALPFLQMPRIYPRYPSRQQIIDYFESYAQHFGIKPRFHQEVVGVEHDGEMWRVTTKDYLYTARFLVLATGYARIPNRPTFPGQDTFVGDILHSSEYRSGASYRGQRVLVVGFGNSGGEIALDLLENGAYPSLSVRSPTNIIPRDILGVPIVSLAVPLSYLPTGFADILTRAVTSIRYGNLAKHGLRRPRYGPLQQIQRDSRIPAIDVGTVAYIKQGRIKVYPQLSCFHREGVSFADGTVQSFGAVIMATGFKPTLPFPLPADLMKEYIKPGRDLREAPYLYRCGYDVVATGMLREINREAHRIAANISSAISRTRSSLPTTSRHLPRNSGT